MILILLLIVGFFLSTYLIREASPVERVAYTLLGAVTVVPFLAINVALAGSLYITRELLLGISVGLLLLLSVHAYHYLRGIKPPKVERRQWIVLAAGALVGVGSAFYYSNAEVLYALGSYLQTGKSGCFTMQTFKLVQGLNPGRDAGQVREIYSIISTPGNALFTGSLMPVLGTHTFHFLYVLFQLNLFFFIYLLLRPWTGRLWILLGVALFAVANPYVLSVEILDRNAMALSLGAALLHTLFKYPDKALLHGALLGVTAGTGLRFLPLCLWVPLLLQYAARRARWQGYALAGAAFAVVFAFNLPHLQYHGFHSMGEARPFYELFFTALWDQPRTPFVPFPNFSYYLVHLLSCWGFLAAALVLFGAALTLARHRLRFVQLTLIFAVPYLVLVAQPDWLEMDKARILICSLLPLLLLAGIGLSTLAERINKLKFNLGYIAAVAVVIAIYLMMIRVEGVPDPGTYTRKPVYQRETGRYMDFYRGQFASANLLPDYGRLFFKTDLKRKGRADRIITARLFGPGGSQAGANKWVEAWLPPAKNHPPAKKVLSTRYVNLSIDLERLVRSPHQSVAVLQEAGETFLDLEKKKDLLDIYYKAVDVSWMKQELPLVIMPDKPELALLGELYLDLNAFAGLGRDADGFERVNIISYRVLPGKRAQGLASSMTALPQQDRKPLVVLRVPEDITVVVRNWVVNASEGVPYRVDAWRITLCQGKPRVEFFCQEPESYL